MMSQTQSQPSSIDDYIVWTRWQRFLRAIGVNVTESPSQLNAALLKHPLYRDQQRQHLEHLANSVRAVVPR